MQRVELEKRSRNKLWKEKIFQKNLAKIFKNLARKISPSPSHLAKFQVTKIWPHLI
jgi:hypothetical protein